MVGYFGLPFVMSLDLQQVRSLCSLGTGVAFLPMVLIGLCLTPFSARIAHKLAARVVITGGLVLMMAGLLILALVPSSTPVWALAVLMVLVGLAGPLVSPPVIAAQHTGTASGVFNASRPIGPPWQSRSSARC